MNIVQHPSAPVSPFRQAVARGPITTPFDLNRSVEEQICERMLAAALYNYRHTTPGAGLADHKTWFDLSEEQRAFYVQSAIPRAIAAIWGDK